MSGVAVLQAAVLAGLRADGVLSAELNGVFEGAAVKASVPFAELGELLAIDWGTKSAAGREVRLAVTLRDAGETSARVQRLGAAAGAAIEALPRDLTGWRLAGVVFLRSRLLRGAPGIWAMVVEYRVRMMAV